MEAALSMDLFGFNLDNLTLLNNDKGIALAS